MPLLLQLLRWWHVPVVLQLCPAVAAATIVLCPPVAMAAVVPRL